MRKVFSLHAVCGIFCLLIACSPGQVALTFDDGPDSSYTETILDILKKEKVRATFFVLGDKCLKNPLLLKRIYDEGHRIGNHSLAHKNFSEYRDSTDMLADIHFVDSLILKITGMKSVAFRPPFGALTQEQKAILQRHGYEIAMWTLSPRDWDVFNVTREDIIRTVKNNIHNNAVILLHSKDVSGAPEKYPLRNNTIEALPGLIAFLKSNHYRFVTYDQVMKTEE